MIKEVRPKAVIGLACRGRLSSIHSSDQLDVGGVGIAVPKFNIVARTFRILGTFLVFLQNLRFFP